MGHIKKIKLHNFRRFKNLSVDFDDKINLLVGDNEAGKSSLLEAISIVLSGSRNKIESVGLEGLFNVDIIDSFLASGREYENLPTLFVELYLNEQLNQELNGNYNSEGIVCDGLRLECVPNDSLSREIKEILLQPNPSFPFEFYSIRFNTFQGDGYSGYKKYLKHILLDNSQISSDYAMKEYVKDMYSVTVSPVEKSKHQNEYRLHKESFKGKVLAEVNVELPKYDFSIRNSSKSNLETDLILLENSINIEHKGKGIQCFIKTEFALDRGGSLDVVLLEEPENHLSHVNMNKMIFHIQQSHEQQIFISTHSNMISSRLDLRKAILLNSSSVVPVSLNSISEETAKFFMKAPNHNLLEFILSPKVILVEGAAEYILMEHFFEKETGNSLADSDVHIISVNGLGFKRYFEIAKKLGIKTACIRDNDGNFQKKCVENYDEYLEPGFLQVFADTDNSRTTFETCVYYDNQVICNTYFNGDGTRDALDYMLKNKTEVAYKLLKDSQNIDINVPSYIKEAIVWINE